MKCKVGVCDPQQSKHWWSSVTYRALFSGCLIDRVELVKAGIVRGDNDESDLEYFVQFPSDEVAPVGIEFVAPHWAEMTDYQKRIFELFRSDESLLFEEQFLEFLNSYRENQDSYLSPSLNIENCVELQDIVVGQSDEDGVIMSFCCDWLPIGEYIDFQYHENGVIKVVSNELIKEIQPFWNYGQID